MDVVLTTDETKLVAHMLWEYFVDHEKITDEITNHYGACLAVAKAINIYPKLTIVQGSPYMLVGRTHARIQVVNSYGYSQFYTFRSLWGDTVVFVIGEMPRYTIAGYVDKSEVVTNDLAAGGDTTKAFMVYAHILKDFKDSFYFHELLNNTWDHTRAYKREDNKWVVISESREPTQSKNLEKQ